MGFSKNIASKLFLMKPRIRNTFYIATQYICTYRWEKRFVKEYLCLPSLSCFLVLFYFIFKMLVKPQVGDFLTH